MVFVEVWNLQKHVYWFSSTGRVKRNQETWKPSKTCWAFKTITFRLILKVLEKLIHTLLEIPIIPQALNINIWITASAKFIKMGMVKKLTKLFLKNLLHRLWLSSWFLSYYFPKLGRYYEPYSGSHGPRWLKLQWKAKNLFIFYGKCLDSDGLSIWGGFEWFSSFLILLSSFTPINIEKYESWDSNNSANFKHQLLENHKCNFFQSRYHYKAYQYSLKKVFQRIFNLTILEIFLFEFRSLLRHAQRITGSDRVKIFMKNQRNVWLLFESLKSACLMGLGGIELFSIFQNFI